MIVVHRLVAGSLVQQDGLDAVVRPEGEARAWLRAIEPTEEEMARLGEVLGLTELAVAGTIDLSQPAKVEDCGDHLLVLIHTPVERRPGHFRKLAVFLGATWLLSVQTDRVTPCEEVEARVVHEPERFLSAPERILHALLDHMTVGFAHRVDGLAERIESLEAAVLDGEAEDAQRPILEVRRALQHLHRVARTQRDVLLTLSRTNHEVLSQRITPYLRDAYDHGLRVLESVEAAREGLGAVRDAWLALVNNRLSETMRVLTVIATIMMPLTLVAGIFGMNFDPMPLLHHPAGFWVASGVMLLVALGMLAWFRRRGWV